MVIFTCNHCGDSLQKPRVEKHYYKCRNYKNLTCVDCLKDFKDEEYTTHTKCLTEDERYAAKGSFPNGVVNKGEVKQEQWTDMIKNIVEKENGLSGSLRQMLQTISTYSNVPRKKPKFINFLRSSLGRQFSPSDAELAWDVIEKYKNESQKLVENNKQTNGDDKKANENGAQKRKNEQVEDDSPQKKKKTNGTQNQVEEENIEAPKQIETFNFKEKILEILNSKHKMSLTKLQKKVMKSYKKATGTTDVSEKIIKKFNKKLKKIQNVAIENDTVTLLESQ